VISKSFFPSYYNSIVFTSISIKMTDIDRIFKNVYCKDDGLGVYCYKDRITFKIDDSATPLSLGCDVPLIDGKGYIIVQKAPILMYDTVMRDNLSCSYKIPVPKDSVVIVNPDCHFELLENDPKPTNISLKRISLKILTDTSYSDTYGWVTKSNKHIKPKLWFLPVVSLVLRENK
jgi:hypothetical protein